MARFFDALTPERMVLSGSPDEAVREALAVLSPPVMSHAAGFTRRGGSSAG